MKIICNCGRVVQVQSKKATVCKCGNRFDLKVHSAEKRSFKKKALPSYRTFKDMFYGAGFVVAVLVAVAILSSWR